MSAVSASSTDLAPRHGFAFWKKVAIETMKTFIDPDTSPRCAATAFFGFLSLFPALATVFLVYGLVADTRLLIETIDTVEYILPGMAVDILREQLVMLAGQPNAALGIGLLISVPLALWSGSRGVDALLFAMSRVRAAPEHRNFFVAVIYAIGLTIVGAIFLVLALLTIAGLPALIPFPTGEDVLLLLLRWPILLGLTVGVIMLVYRFGPDRHPRKLRYVWPGALLASILWILAGAVFSIYVENWGNYNDTFGSVSAAVVLLLWMYNSAQIFVFGAAFNAEIERAIEPAAPVRTLSEEAAAAVTSRSQNGAPPRTRHAAWAWPLAVVASAAWFVGTLVYDRVMTRGDAPERDLRRR